MLGIDIYEWDQLQLRNKIGFISEESCLDVG